MLEKIGFWAAMGAMLVGGVGVLVVGLYTAWLILTLGM